MDFDHKLLIAAVALALSIYNYFSSRRISTLEKRIQVMSEAGEVYMFYVEMRNIYDELAIVGKGKSRELNESVIKCRDTLKETIESVSDMFEAINRGNGLSSEQYEKMQPGLQQVIRECKVVLENARKIRKQAFELINNA